MNILDTLTTAWQSAALGARTIVGTMFSDRNTQVYMWNRNIQGYSCVTAPIDGVINITELIS